MEASQHVEAGESVAMSTEAEKSGGALAPVRCMWIGCDAMFTDNDNPDGSCHYHPSIGKSKSSMNHPEVVIARQAIEEGRGLVVIVNKMDLLRENQPLFDKVTDAVPKEIQTVIPQVTGIPVVFMSALEGRGRVAVMRQVIDTYEKWCLRLSTSRLNRWLRKVMSRHSWKDSATQPKVKYFTQVKARPPTFVAFMSGKAQLSDTDIRFLTKSLKDDFNIGGIPIRVVQRSIPRKASVKSNSRSVGPRIIRMKTDKRTTASDPTL